MSSETLYRKYRPASFDDVVGQDVVVNALQSMIRDARVPHALLLVGSRGTGKTTLARIIARSMGIDSVDIYEMDAASNRGIDRIRELRDDVMTVPVVSPKKVYILDEVHMFTNDAWNALLKTLEEPPAHVLFIMATTEYDKVPETIISRSSVMQLRMPGDDALLTVINRVAQSEGYTIDDDARELLLTYADGSFRNALVGLEQVMNCVEGTHVTADTVATQLAIPPLAVVRDFLLALSNKTTDTLIHILGAQQVGRPEFFVRLLIDRVRMVMAVRFRVNITVPENDREIVTAVASNTHGPINAGCLLRLITVLSDMRRSGNPELVFQAFVYEELEKLTVVST